jgi:hypothetical protein
MHVSYKSVLWKTKSIICKDGRNKILAVLRYRIVEFCARMRREKLIDISEYLGSAC